VMVRDCDRAATTRFCSVTIRIFAEKTAISLSRSYMLRRPRTHPGSSLAEK
jgi:hypothetical protein